MKPFLSSALCAAVLLSLAPTNLSAATTPAGYIDFGKLAPDESGGEFVEVNINSNLVAMVTRLAQKAEPEVADLLLGLKSIRVNVIGLNEDNHSAIESKVKSIRSQLDTQGWDRIVTAQQKTEDVGVYIKLRGPEAVEGIVVTVLSGKKQAVLINVVGDIKPEKLGTLGERFNIEPLKKVGQGIKAQQAEDDDTKN